MATYSELANIRNDAGFGDLTDKVRVAVVIKAVTYLNSATPTTPEVDWAMGVLAGPAAAGETVVWYVIGDNSTASIAQIVGANDATVQSAVDFAVEKIVAGGS